MFQINSERIRLLALNAEQLYLLAEDRNRLERVLALNLSQFELNADGSFLQELVDAIKHQVIHWVIENPENYLWYTHWLIIEKKSNITVGGIGGAGLPDGNGEAMIGYYIDKKSEGKGYATEAVELFTNWMFQHPELKTVVADTLVDGIASQKVLQKNGFIQTGTTGEGLRWCLSKR